MAKHNKAVPDIHFSLARRNFIRRGGAALLLSPAAVLWLSGAGQANAGAAFRLRQMYDPALTGLETFGRFDIRIDISEERNSAWKKLRSLDGNSGDVGIISGTSRWSDFLIIRGHLESCGMRLVKSVEHNAVFHWQFVSRSLLRIS